MSDENNWGLTLQLKEDAEAAPCAPIIASDLEGWEVYTAYVKFVFQNLKALVCREWVCFEHPQCSKIFDTGFLKDSDYVALLDEDQMIRYFERKASRSDYDSLSHPATIGKCIPYTVHFLASRQAEFLNLFEERKLIAPGLPLRLGGLLPRWSGVILELPAPSKVVPAVGSSIESSAQPAAMRNGSLGKVDQMPGGAQQITVKAMIAMLAAQALDADTMQNAKAGVSIDPGKHDGTKYKKSAEDRCLKWLIGEMKKSPQQRPMPKGKYREEAQKRFSGLSERSFITAWSRAVKETRSAWSAHGRPVKKSLFGQFMVS
jgi:hypothetical protein